MTPTVSEHEEPAFAAPHRFGLRRGRLQPGPLSAVPRRRAVGWQIPAALVVALAVAGSATAYLALRSAPQAGTGPASPVETVAAQDATVATPVETAALRPSADVPAMMPSPVPAQTAEEPHRADRAATAIESAAGPPAQPEHKPAPDTSSFQLSSLPVLEADEASLGLDQMTVEPPRAAAKPAAPRRTTAARPTAPKAATAPPPIQ